MAQLRVQKFLAAKAASSKKGREILTSMLGDDGEAVISAVLSFIKKWQGAQKSELIEKCIFKVLAKTVILIQNDKIKITDLDAIADSTKAFCWALIDQCELSMVLFEPAPLIKYIEDTCKFMTLLLAKHTTGKTVERIKTLQEFFSAKATISALLQDEKCRDDKAELSFSLTVLLKALAIQRAMDEQEKDPKENKDNSAKPAASTEKKSDAPSDKKN
jgi:hypothetical protein